MATTSMSLTTNAFMLPARGLAEPAVRISQRTGKLARGQDGRIDLAEPRGHQGQLTGLATRAEDRDVASELLAYDADRLDQIGIVRDVRDDDYRTHRQADVS